MVSENTPWRCAARIQIASAAWMPASSIAASGSVAASAAAARASGADEVGDEEAEDGAEREAADAAFRANARRRGAVNFGEPEPSLERDRAGHVAHGFTNGEAQQAHARAPQRGELGHQRHHHPVDGGNELHGERGIDVEARGQARERAAAVVGGRLEGLVGLVSGFRAQLQIAEQRERGCEVEWRCDIGFSGRARHSFGFRRASGRFRLLQIGADELQSG